MRIFDRSDLKSLFAKWGRAFVVAFVFAVFASGLVLLDTFRGYQSEIRVLVIMRAGQSAESADQVIGNIAELPKNLSFYERVLADNDFLEDRFAGQTPDDRKALWNETVSVTQSDESGMLMIRAEGESPEEARLLAEQTGKTLFAVTGRYYDIRTDIDMRVVDGPITGTVVVSPVLYVVTSIVSGFIVTLLFFVFLSLLEKIPARRLKKRETLEIFVPHDEAPKKTFGGYAQGDSVPYIDPRTFVPKRPTSLISSFESQSQEIHPVKKEEKKEAVHTGTKASAPANLPIAEEEVSLSFGSGVTEIMEEPIVLEKEPKEKQAVFGDEKIMPAKETPAEEDLSREPTIEEYKRRLNELLSGGK